MSNGLVRPIIKPTNLPVINVAPGIMPLPAVVSRVALSRNHPPMMRLLDEIKTGQMPPYVFAVMSSPGIKGAPDRFFKTGVVCSVETSDDQVLLKGEYRVEATASFRLKDKLPDSYWTVSIALIQDENIGGLFVDPHYSKQIRADLIKIKYLLQRLYNEGMGFWNFPAGGDIISGLIDDFENQDFNDKDAVDYFIWLSIAALPELLQEDKQPFLESTNLLERITMLIKLLKSEIETLNAYKREGKDVKSTKIGPNQMEDPENLKSNEDKLFEKAHPTIKKMWKRFKKSREFMTEAAQKVTFEDLQRLLSYGGPTGNSYEWPKFERRVNLTLNYPWEEESKQKEDIGEVARILDEDHYGLEQPKQKICDQIAPRILNPAIKSQILCFIGAPGVGKTSLAKSIARALELKLIRISIGGIRDEVQIRGHSITYVGSQPGEIIREMVRAGVKNPVFVIDEIDKVGHDSVGGNPAAALLEMLDPEQNNSFKDHYLDYGVDLSKVFFIATANVEHTIIPALRDRMDIIRLPGYLEIEKMEIAKRFLIPRWTRDVGLEQVGAKVEWNDDVVALLVKSYTCEAGVRELERNIATILRRLTRHYLESKRDGNVIKEFTVTKDLIVSLLGPEKLSEERARPTVVGEAIGLVWTPVGGDISYVQTKFIPRIKEQFTFSQTGLQGKVMSEANKVALTLVREKAGDNPEVVTNFEKNSIHLHVPEGAIPKDGPSAGITAFIALRSLVNKKLVRPGVAMTGEINLSGRVTAVGGIREKVVGAERAGIIEVIMPKENERNLYDVPKSVKEKLKFHFVETIDEVIDIAFS